jgi:hypothetical protein
MDDSSSSFIQNEGSSRDGQSFFVASHKSVRFVLPACVGSLVLMSQTGGAHSPNFNVMSAGPIMAGPIILTVRSRIFVPNNV